MAQTWPSTVYTAFYDVLSRFRADNVEDGLTAFRAYLNDPEKNPNIRVFVDGELGFAHQSASANLIRRLSTAGDATPLAGLGYAGTIDIHYSGGAATLKVLRDSLLPDANWNGETGQLGDATLQLAAGMPTADAPIVNLGFSGGAGKRPRLATELRTEYLLLLQPYRWPAPSEIQFNGDSRPPIELETQSVVGGASFTQRAYAQTAVALSAAQWQQYINVGGDFGRNAELIQWLTEAAQLADFDLLPICGFRAPEACEMGTPTSERLVQLVAACLDSQLRGTQAAAGAKPIVIINLDTYAPTTTSNNGFDYVRSVLAGAPTSAERPFLPTLDSTRAIDTAAVNREDVRIYNTRNAYLTALAASTRADFLSGRFTTDAARSFVESARGKKDQLRFIQLGPVSQPVFDVAFASNTLPSVFEDFTTANLALNLGRPYLQVAPPRANQIQYPSAALGVPEAAGSVATELQRIANQIHVDLANWPVTTAAPPAIIADFIRAWRAETEQGRYHAYFADIKAFYQEAANDKFNLGANYLNYLINGPSDAPLTLDALYDHLQSAVDESGSVNLADPRLYDQGLIADILGAVVDAVSGAAGDALTVEVDEEGGLVREPADSEIEIITLSGTTDFFGLATRVEVQYSAPEQQVVAQISFTAEEATWSIDAAPWLVFSKPCVQLDISNALIPSVGAIGGTLTAGPTAFSFFLPLPGEENIWLFQASTDESQPISIDYFFSLAGGINLIQILPAPFNVLASVGLSQLELQYDDAAGQVNYLAFTMQTSESVPLFNDISLQDLNIQTTINNPASLAERDWQSSIQGLFAIATEDPEQPAVVELSAEVPALEFQGSLASGELKILDVINQFIPGTPLPDGLDSPTITDFSFNYAYESGNLSASMDLNTNFQFPSAADPVFTLQSLTFNLARESGNTVGGIGAKVILFENPDNPAAELPLDISAQYLGKGEQKEDLGWIFSATQTGDGIFLDQLLEHYFGPNWLSDQVAGLGFADLGITLETATSSWKFSGRTAEPWSIPFLPGLPPIGASVELGYNGAGATSAAKVATSNQDLRALTPSAPGRPVNGLALLSAERATAATPGLYGTIGLNIYFNSIPATVLFNFDPDTKSFELNWIGFTVKVEQKAPDAALLSLPDVGLIRADANTRMAVAADPAQQWIATFTLPDKSLGEMVEMFISWATGSQFGLASPWNLLDHISLADFELQWNFSTNQVTFKVNVGPINLGFANIKAIGVNYDSQNSRQRSVNVTIEGSFLWDIEIDANARTGVTTAGDQQLTWDATKPEKTPAPPGGGNKYLDLRLLALGQRVSISGLAELDTVEKLIAKLRELPNNEPDAIPVGGPGQPQFDPESAWLIATDFGVLRVDSPATTQDPATAQARMRSLLPIGQTLPTGAALAAADDTTDSASNEYMVALSIVFNDPKLYALRIALAGPAAKILAGLAFEIMYRQISDNVGVYSSRLTLPTAMRRLDVGVYTITLPEFAIEIYTNGDFFIDIGFPYNQDFSVSFTIEGIVAPGIPVLGSAGFYFGKLSSETSNDVPAATNGWFNPVIVVGFGAQIGVGKSVSAGILEAGFSITVFGIIEGVIAQWHPFDDQLPANRNQLQDSYYFAISGTVGIQGRLYGTINFAIVQANVDISVKAMASIVYMSFADIPISVSASVSISVSVKINLGLFKITVRFSFAATIKATFVIANSGDAPWQIESGNRTQARVLRMQRRLNTSQAQARALVATGFEPVWSRLLAPAATTALQGYFAPALTVAGDAASQSGDLSQQVAAYVLSFFIDTAEPAAGDSTTEIHASHAAARTVSDDAFETLCLQVTRWLIAAGQPEDIDSDAVGALVISDVELEQILDYLGNPDDASPIPAKAINDFLNAQFSIAFRLQIGEGNANAVFFPAAPGLHIQVPAYGDNPAGVDYRIDDYNATSADYAQWLRSYFQELAVAVQQEEDDSAALRLNLADSSGPAVGVYVFQDYFNLIGRQMISSLRSGLRNFQYPLVAGQSVNDILKLINTTGALEGDDAVTAADLFEANSRHLLSTGKPITIAGSQMTTPAGLSFDGVAALDTLQNADGTPYFNGSALAAANLTATTLLQPGIAITARDGNSYLVRPGDSLQRIAEDGFHTTPQDLIDNSDVTRLQGLLITLAPLNLPEFVYTTAEGDTLDSVAGRFAITLDLLAATSSNVEDISDLFDPSVDPDLAVPHLPQYRVSELIDEAVRSLAVQHLGGMASRYYLHGLRLPTEGVTPLQPGIFVSGSAPDLRLPDEIGLFALLGQEIALPVLNDTDTFGFTLSADDGSPWLRFTTGQQTRSAQAAQTEPSSSLNFELSDPDDLARVQAVVNYATGQRLETDTTALTPAASSALTLASFTFQSQTVWQSAGIIPLPISLSAPPQVPALGIWNISPAMAALPGVGRAIEPAFEIDIGRYDQASGQLTIRKAQNVGPASIVRFTVKRVPEVETSPSTQRTYEILGTGATDVLTLERILTGADDSDYLGLDLLFPQGSADGQPALQSFNRADTVFGISQVNLSTVTRPPAGRAALAARASAEDGGQLLNTPAMFIRLLWEASITRAGGFFLYFDAVAEDQGLPEAIFNDQDEAEIAVLVLYRPRGALTDGAFTVPAFVNCVVTNDAIDSAQDQVYAQAVAQHIDLSVGGLAAGSRSLSAIAYAHFTDAPAVIGEDPTTAGQQALRSGGQVTIENGLYQVPPTGEQPGGALADIAAWFGLTEAQIRAANPDSSTWPTVLPPLMALRLPTLTVTVGSSPGGTTLAALSSYYRVPVAALATANADRQDLLAEEAGLVFDAGPTHRSAANRVGVVANTLTRTIPPEIPDQADAEYARIYLQHVFNMLGYKVIDTVDFRESNMGLPVGPTHEDESEELLRKVRTPTALLAGDDWDYLQSIPYNALAKAQPSRALGTTAGATSPYAGVGGLLQTDFAWFDLYGNTAVSHLSDPKAGDTTPLNRPPVITGYTDALLGPGQWPAASLAYTLQGGGGASPTIALVFAFDFNRYNPFDDNDGSGDEQWRENAARDLVTYQSIHYQLQDPLGISMHVETSLIDGDKLTLTDAQRAAIIDWAYQLQTFLLLRADGDSSTAPPAALSVAVTLEGDALNPALIYELDMNLVLSRRLDLVAGALRRTPGVGSVRTAVSPSTGNIETFNDPSKTRDLTAFAQALTQALSGLGDFECRACVGTNREAPPESRSRQRIWIVRLGTTSSPEGISYRLHNDIAPVLYAPRPLSNVLISRTVAIHDYVTDQGISTDATRNPSFTDIDVDRWLLSFLSQVDALLSPRFVTPALILDAARGTFLLQQLLDAKQALATGFRQLMIPVFADSATTPTGLEAAQEGFRQSMLERLANAFNVAAAAQYAMDVSADIAQDYAYSPRLFGTVVPSSGEVLDPSRLSLTTPKLDLRTTTEEAPAALTFLISTSADANQADASIPLDLVYQGRSIEHQIGTIPGVGEGYLASSWLSFLDLPADANAENWPLTQALGKIDVPLIIREYPQVPSMLQQQSLARSATDSATDVDAVIGEAKRWNYGFIYSLQLHRPQDRIHATVSFNIKDDSAARLLAAERDLFDELAEFVTVYPKVEADLETFLAPLTAATTNEGELESATVALESAVQLVANVAAKSADPSLRQASSLRISALLAAADVAPDASFVFSISESAQTVESPAQGQVEALLITLEGQRPSGVDVPVVQIEGYTAVPFEQDDDERVSYLYQKDGQYLEAVTGMAIADRHVIIPGMDIMVRQDALSEVQLTRNEEFDGQRTADPFVYHTPAVTFTGPLHPTNTLNDGIDMSRIGQGNSDQHIKRSLAGHLQALFAALFADTTLEQQLIQVALAYDYSVNDALSPIQLPVYFMPCTPVLISGTPTDDQTGLDTMIETLANRFQDWHSGNQVSTQQAVLRFDLTILSSLTRQPAPVLQLGNVYVAVAYLS